MRIIVEPEAKRALLLMLAISATTILAVLTIWIVQA